MELVLSTFGTLLSRKDNCLLVTSSERQQRLSVNDVRSIQIGPGVQLTSESVMLAIEIVPLATSNVESMHIIGRTLDLDLVLKNRSTIFF